MYLNCTLGWLRGPVDAAAPVDQDGIFFVIVSDDLGSGEQFVDFTFNILDRENVIALGAFDIEGGGVAVVIF